MPILSPLSGLTQILKKGDYEVSFLNNTPTGILIRNQDDNPGRRGDFQTIWASIDERQDATPLADRVLTFNAEDDITPFLRDTTKNRPKNGLFDSGPKNFDELIERKIKQDKIFLNELFEPAELLDRVTLDKERGTMQITLPITLPHEQRAQSAIGLLGLNRNGLTLQPAQRGEPPVQGKLPATITVNLRHYLELVKTLPHLKTLTETKVHHDFTDMLTSDNVVKNIENGEVPGEFRWKLDNNEDPGLIIFGMTLLGINPKKFTIRDGSLFFNDDTLKIINDKLGVPGISPQTLHNRCAEEFLFEKIGKDADGRVIEPELLASNDSIFISLHSLDNQYYEDEDDDASANAALLYHTKNTTNIANALMLNFNISAQTYTRDDAGIKHTGLLLSPSEFNKLTHLNVDPRIMFKNMSESTLNNLNTFCDRLRLTEQRIQEPYLQALVDTTPFTADRLTLNEADTGFTLNFDNEAARDTFKQAILISCGFTLDEGPNNSLLLSNEQCALLALKMNQRDPTTSDLAKPIIQARLASQYFAPGASAETRLNFAKGGRKEDDKYIEMSLSVAEANAYRSLFGIDLGSTGQTKLRLKKVDFEKLFPNVDFNGALTAITQKIGIPLVPIVPPIPQPNPIGGAGFSPVLSPAQRQLVDTRVQQLYTWRDERNNLLPLSCSVTTIYRGDPMSPLYQVNLHNTTDATQQGTFTYNPRTNAVTAEKDDLDKLVIREAMLEVTGVQPTEAPLMEVTLPNPPNLTTEQKKEQLDLAVKMFTTAIEKGYIPIVESTRCPFAQTDILAKLPNTAPNDVKAQYEQLKMTHATVLSNDKGWGNHKIAAVESVAPKPIAPIVDNGNDEANKFEF
ncbi:MAG: hypothetical protein K2Q14_05770 [Gammaproteobacteria bacterium]|nr:hypothetical protein [Gammaproteobacteria bacterium]